MRTMHHWTCLHQSEDVATLLTSSALSVWLIASWKLFSSHQAHSRCLSLCPPPLSPSPQIYWNFIHCSLSGVWPHSVDPFHSVPSSTYSHRSDFLCKPYIYLRQRRKLRNSTANLTVKLLAVWSNQLGVYSKAFGVGKADGVHCCRSKVPTNCMGASCTSR